MTEMTGPEGGLSFEEYLDKYGSLTYTNVGVSMMPLLRQGKDLFIVRKKGAERCSAGDVVLYKRPHSSYVLHRIVEVRENDYVILGDNCIRKEYGIKDSDILGVMTGFVRSGKEHSVNDKNYRLYTDLWMRGAKLRIFCTKTLLAAKRRVKGLRGSKA